MPKEAVEKRWDEKAILTREGDLRSSKTVSAQLISIDRR